ncbi:hypothetical protein JAB1_14310 [Janthinobacterium sp. MP5059B]|uniref:hypothetical protein n=1 Tax=Janthinobacterium sp. MP5059B TaxID=1766683 RepID=UPI000892B392|nr:hypothetical protein [Janthinobacterium sp. MP5059B]OEZ50316.1 hypothetical protein JAB1_14310 [Janthinobacterium sp. MP5059B]
MSYNQAGPDESIEDKIHELENELAIKSAKWAAAVNHVAYVKANEGDVEAAQERVREAKVFTESIEAHLKKLRQLVGRG